METRTLVKLPIHEHLLSPSPRFVRGDCDGCRVDGTIYGGYICSEPTCITWFHKECAKAPLEINHSSHLQHPLFLTKYEEDYTCNLCGKEHILQLSTIGYRCSICDFDVDLTCGMKPPLSDIEQPICHDHSLVFLKKQEEEISCEVCKGYSINGEPFYTCLQCHVYFHVECVQHGKEVNHPCHSNHLLKLVISESLMDDAEKSCLLCGDEEQNMCYHCSICNFTSCLACTKNPPPLVIDHTKVHKHPLTLFSRKLSATCNYCGEKEQLRPYMCLQCDFVIDGWCIGLPRIININRHDHRIFFTDHLGSGYSNCGVCRESMNQYSGGYNCSICPSYAVHSHCAIGGDVWDGVELEEIPEIFEDITPFKVVGDNLIIHVSHKKHILKLNKGNFVHDKLARCAACSHTIGFDPIYSCEKCCYILHEKCANLPLKKRLVFDALPFKLIMEVNNGILKVLDCECCGIFSIGFKYTSPRLKEVDMHCASLLEPLVHNSHLHPLYFYNMEGHTCDACTKNVHGFNFRCETCDLDLCLSCASLSETIRYSSHEHPITLCYGENVNDKYWCDICENELNSSKWFYTCYDCGVTLHIECVIGDFSRLMPGFDIDYFGYKFGVVLNDHNTRPICHICFSRCKFSVNLKDLKEDDTYICSRLCFLSLFKEI